MGLNHHPSTEQARQGLHERVEVELTLHPPTAEQGQRMDAVRAKAKELAHLVIDSANPGRELSIYLTEQDSALRWAISAIAREDTTSGA